MTSPAVEDSLSGFYVVFSNDRRSRVAAILQLDALCTQHRKNMKNINLAHSRPTSPYANSHFSYYKVVPFWDYTDHFLRASAANYFNLVLRAEVVRRFWDDEITINRLFCLLHGYERSVRSFGDLQMVFLYHYPWTASFDLPICGINEGVLEFNFAWIGNLNQHVSTRGVYVFRTFFTRLWKHVICLDVLDSTSLLYDCAEPHLLQISRGLSRFSVVMDILSTSIISTTSV